MKHTLNFSIRLRAAGLHLGVSVLAGSLAAALVFGLWYPIPYREISGGQSLFLLMVSVDLVLGPALTFVVRSPGKKRAIFLRDLAVIAVLQIGALAYGLNTVFQARPVALVYEPGRFRVVTNLDLRREELPWTAPDIRNLSIAGPVLRSVREPRDNNEKLQAIDMALQGVDLGQRPSFWQPYQAGIPGILKEGRPVDVLMRQYPDRECGIVQYLSSIGRNADEVKFIPILAKQSNWSALIDAKTGEIVGYVPCDGFI